MANIDVFRKEKTLVHLRPKIRLLSRLLHPLRQLRHVGDIRQQGFMAGIELVLDRDGKIPYPLTLRIGHRIAQEARGRGLLIRPLGNILVLMPPLSTDDRTLARMVDILSGSIQTITERNILTNVPSGNRSG